MPFIKFARNSQGEVGLLQVLRADAVFAFDVL
jgi:hypothetical protein